MKMPEPVAWTSPSWLSNPHAGHYSARRTDCFDTPLYDKQALIDLLEAAAVECDQKRDAHLVFLNHQSAMALADVADSIRSMKEKL